MTFGERLKMLRIKKGLTQSKLAQIINLSKANISKYETGSVEPNLKSISLLSEYFDVTTDFLLGKTDFETNKNISAAEATEILKCKFIEYGIIKEGADITAEQLDDYVKKLSIVLTAFKN